MSNIKTVTGELHAINRRVNRHDVLWTSAQVGGVEVLLFPQIFAEHAEKLVDGANVTMRGRLEYGPGGVTCALIVNEVL